MSSVGHSSIFLQIFHFSLLLGSPRLISLMGLGMFQQGDPTSYIIRKKRAGLEQVSSTLFERSDPHLQKKVKLERLNMG